MRLAAREWKFDFPRPPIVMGIVNLGADSFSGDGLPDLDAALARSRSMIEAGAEIIDVGAESARTNREPIGEDEESERLCAFLEGWTKQRLGARVALSINTWRPAVVRTVLRCGGDILNDIGGLPTDENARLCAETGAALLIMHSVGEPKRAHTHVQYDDVMRRLDEFFEEKLALAQSAGVLSEALILDPGIDFAKQRADNLRVYRELDRLHRFGRPLLLPVSRKTTIGEVLGISDPAARDAGTIACIVQGMLRGAQIFRVHNVAAAVQAIRMISAVEEAGA